MKRIGPAGRDEPGLARPSTTGWCNEATRERLAASPTELRAALGRHSPRRQLQRLGDWDAQSTTRRRRAVVRVTPSMLDALHLLDAQVAGAIAAASMSPCGPCADPAAEPSVAQGLSDRRAARDRFTMEQDFYVGRLRDRHGLDVRVPGARRTGAIVHDVIYDELCVGVIDDGSRDRVPADHAWRSPAAAPRAILLGCTEIDLLVGPGDAPRPSVRHEPPARRARASSWPSPAGHRARPHQSRDEERDRLRGLGHRGQVDALVDAVLVLGERAEADGRRVAVELEAARVRRRGRGEQRRPAPGGALGGVEQRR